MPKYYEGEVDLPTAVSLVSELDFDLRQRSEKPTDLTIEERLTRAVNMLTWEERWDDLDTSEIVGAILTALGEPDRLALLDGEFVSAYVVKRSKQT